MFEWQLQKKSSNVHFANVHKKQCIATYLK